MRIRALGFTFVTFVAACGKVDPIDPDAGTSPPIDAETPIDATVAISPAAPRTTDDLVATITGAGAGLSLRWSQDGAPRPDLAGATVDAAETIKHETWTVELVDGGGAVIDSDEVEILNTPPSAPVAGVPGNVGAGQPIVCLVSVPSTDADGDTLAYTASWLENGGAYGGATTTSFTDDTVPGADTQQGDEFVCSITASDGEESSPASASVTAGVSCPTPGPTTFGYTGAEQTYTVPCGTTQLRIEAWGSQGAGPSGGLGGYVRGELAVTEGQVLRVYVGGRTGFNGGGIGQRETEPAHGGGASDVRSGGAGLGNRVIVAGGGGGGPSNTEIPSQGPYTGGAGGGGTCGANYCGGGGGLGYSTGDGAAGGSSGGTAPSCSHCGGAGGAGVSSGGGRACDTAYNTCGTDGLIGVGGNGGPVNQPICYDTYAGTAGGGGGYYGGGGSSIGFCGGGGGGGGSSWTSLANLSMTGGVRTGDGQVVITPL